MGCWHNAKRMIDANKGRSALALQGCGRDGYMMHAEGSRIMVAENHPCTAAMKNQTYIGTTGRRISRKIVGNSIFGLIRWLGGGRIAHLQAAGG